MLKTNTVPVTFEKIHKINFAPAVPIRLPNIPPSANNTITFFPIYTKHSILVIPRHLNIDNFSLIASK